MRDPHFTPMGDESDPFDGFPGLRARYERAREIARVFLRHGATIDAVNAASALFTNVAFFLECPDDEALTQETGDRASDRVNTRAPVERAERAVTELIHAIQECWDVAEVEVDAGKINVSRRFVEEVCGADFDCSSDEFGEWFLGTMLQVSIPIGRALEAGVTPSKGRPRLHYYERFAIKLMDAAASVGIKPRCDEGEPSEAMVAIALACDPFLSKGVQARDKLTAANRLRAAITRRSQNKSASCPDLIALPIEEKS